MLNLLHIENIAVIESADISFDSGFNVLTGETGAGKSIVIDAISAILGERAYRDMIRTGTNKASVRAVFTQVPHYSWFEENGVEPTNDEIVSALNITEYELREAYDSCVEPASIYDPIYNDGGDTIYLLDQIADKNVDSNRDDIIALRKALKQIKGRERDILVKRYIVGKTQMELASELGVSQAQISRIEKSAIKNVKKLIKYYFSTFYLIM